MATVTLAAVAPDSAQERFTGGGTWMAVGGGLGVLGLLVTAVLFFASASDPHGQQMVLASYLTAFVYWLGIAIAATLWQAVFHAAKARWVTVIRRGLEGISAALPLFILLFLPIALQVMGGHGVLFDWVHPPASFSNEQLKLIAHKAPYLNPTFFIIRAVIYFAVWVGVSHSLRKWSLAQDVDGNPQQLEKMRTLGPASLPFLGLTISFAAFDWMMSLDPFWSSTIFGAYYFAGSFLAAMAVLTFVATSAMKPGQFGALLTRHHLHNLGKFILAFTAFWAYIGFSQFMLIWIANLPEEGEWYIARMKGGWQSVSIALVVLHFIVPFFALLSRSLKFRPWALKLVAVWILLIHFVDLHWVIMPAIHLPHFAPHLADLTAFLGVGGVAIAFALWRARGHYTVPVRDPYLLEAVRYTQP